MPIECKIDLNRSLLSCMATGELTFEALKVFQEKYFEIYMTQNVILDLRLISANKLVTRDIEAIVEMSEMKKDLRPANSKTAIVATYPLVYGLARMYGVFFELRELPWELEVFDSMGKALDWIGPGDMRAPENAFHSHRVYQVAHS